MAAVTPQPFGTLAEPATLPRRGMQAGRRRRLNVFRYVVFIVFGLFFVLPVYAMVAFSLKGTTGHFSLSAWTQIVSYPNLLSAIEVTLELAVLACTVILVLLVPTMIWIQLRVQWISRTVEFLCLLPLTIPAIVLVVGLAPIYRGIRIHISLSALQLFWVYAILALPYAYRALAAGLAAIDTKTLSEAARSLGAGWFTVIWRVVVPNMGQAVLNAMILTSALVLGEFTIASLLLYTNLQTSLYYISRDSTNAGVLFSTSSAALIFAFLLLLILSFAGRRRGRR